MFLIRMGILSGPGQPGAESGGGGGDRRTRPEPEISKIPREPVGFFFYGTIFTCLSQTGHEIEHEMCSGTGKYE